MILTADPTYVGNLKPVKYQWAYDLYQQAIRNTWFPHEIQLGEDVADWHRLTDDEQHAVTFLMSYFNPSEFLVNNALAFGVYPFVAPPEAKMYLSRQMFEEANHSMSFEYVLETFEIDQDKAYSGFEMYESMKRKEDFILKYLNRMLNKDVNIETMQGKQYLVENLVAYNVIMEGIFFYSGFMLALSFRQRNILRNFASLIDWVLRDESLHLQFGINLLLTVLEENPDIMTEDFAARIHNMIVEAVALESQYNKDALPNGILGLNAEYINQYVEYVADRRLEELGFPAHFGTANPAKWMTTATDVPELVNFFEATNTSYEVNAQGNS
jgi:ribonucleoside-diphosphate reductase beta chain